jgi:hypothetical protein
LLDVTPSRYLRPPRAAASRGWAVCMPISGCIDVGQVSRNLGRSTVTQHGRQKRDRRRATSPHESADGIPTSSEGRALHSSSNARGLAAVSPSARAAAVHRWTTTNSPKRSWKITTPFSLRIAQVCGHVPAQQHRPVCPPAAHRRPHPCGLEPRALSGLGSDALPQRRDVPVALLASPGVNGRSSAAPPFVPTVRNNWDSSSALQPTWVRGCRMALEFHRGGHLTVAVHPTDW